MRLLTGDECGLLKETIPELSRRRRKSEDESIPPKSAMPHVSKDGVCRIDPKERQTRSRGVVDMTFTPRCLDGGSDENDGMSFASLRLNGSVERWEGSTTNRNAFGNYDKIYTTENLFQGKGRRDIMGRPLGLGVFQSQSRMCAGDMLGNLAVIKTENGDVVAHYNAYTASKRGDTISYIPGKTLNTQLATAMACDAVNRRVAVGGRERETTMIDIETGNVIFKAKNLPPDPQTLLQQPVWPTSILFLDDSNLMAVGTAYKQLRLYDVRDDSKMRRPTATTPEGLLEYRVTALCQVDTYDLVVGDAAGYIYSLDLRTLSRNSKDLANKNMGRYVGPAGSVRQLKKHPTLPRMAAVGLDRMLRIYDTNKRKQIDCIYLKQRLNCVLFGRDGTWATEDDRSNNNVQVDEDDWDIDQDDVVRDYVDSDEEENDESDSKPGKESMKEEERSDSSRQDEDSEDEQNEDIDGSGEVSNDETNDETSSSDQQGEDFDSDKSEESSVKAPRKKRRSR